MKFEVNAKDSLEQKPTFFQFCKDNKDTKLPARFYVQKIWMPNKFPTATLETEKFRVRISSKSAVWQTIEESIPEWDSRGYSLAIAEVNPETYDYTIEVVEDEYSVWSPLGQTGLELTIQPKPKTKRTKSA